MYIDQATPLIAYYYYYYYYYYYLLRPKVAQHNIAITKTEETHKKLKTKIETN